MNIEPTTFDNVYLLQADIMEDARGCFYESWNELDYTRKSLLFDLPSETALKDDGTLNTTYFVQDNVSTSKKGVFRGLHYQTGDYGQTKLVRVLKGSVIDFVVDLREKSDTYGKFEYFELNDRNKTSLFVPPYFAHGFLALEDDTIFTYKCGNYYNKENEGGIYFADPIIRQIKNSSDTIFDIIQMYYPCDNENDLLLSYKDIHAPKFLKRKY